jgi:hypothetical protein
MIEKIISRTGASREKTIQRFLSKATLDDNTGCLVWRLADHTDGYGRFYRSLAHRVSYSLFVSKIPDGLCVLHKCDNRKCVNPDHLMIGTQADNMQDMMRKGRGNGLSLPGEKSPNAKLTTENVKSIRHLYFAERRSRRELAKFFSISINCISSVVNKRTWDFDKWKI